MRGTNPHWLMAGGGQCGLFLTHINLKKIQKKKIKKKIKRKKKSKKKFKKKININVLINIFLFIWICQIFYLPLYIQQ